MPRVSVVIPSYNMGRFLKETVESVLNQTYRDFEVIVIDDGSTDNTYELASGFPPIVQYYRQENQGLSAVRNRGIELAGGEYIIFLDSDDIMLENALENGVNFLDQHPEVGLCHGQHYTMDVNGRPLRLRKPRGPVTTVIRDIREDISHLLLTNVNEAIHPSTALIRRSCFKKVGKYNTNLAVSEDVDMWLRISRFYPVGHLAEPVARIRFHPQSITAISNVEAVKSAHTTVLESVFSDVEIGPIFQHLYRKAYFGLYCLCARVAARTGHKGIGLKYLLKALKTCPAFLWERNGLCLLTKSTKDFIPWPLRRIALMLLMSVRLR